MTPRWVLFDADGTLFDFDRAAAAAMAETFAAHDLPFTDDLLTVYEEINARAWRAFEAGEITSTQLRVSRFRDFLAAVDAEVDPESFGRRYLRHLAGHHDLLPGAAEVVTALAGRVGLLLITNGLAEVQQPRFAAAPICRHFHDIVISGVVGVAKPDPRIFDVAFARMGDPPRGEVVMVGDSLTSDMQGGHDYGLATCWYNPTDRPRLPAVPVTHEFRELSALPALLGL
jgi:2-haloacid dehalogenase